MSYDYSNETVEMSWLKKYTLEGMDAFPDSDVIERLVAAHPHAGGTLYRGLNFSSKNQFDNFVASTEDFTKLESGGVSSWTRLDGTAQNFSITRPTYFLNSELMEAESKKNREHDYMIGYAGVVLAIDVGAGIGIDVNTTIYSKEDEVILPPGSYKIRLHKVLHPFMHSINESNVAEEFLSIGSLEGRENSHNQQKFNHIINRFDNFTDEMKSHLFKSIMKSMPTLETQVSMGKCHDSVSGRFRDSIPQIYVGWNVPAEFFECADKFLPEDRKSIQDQLAGACEELDAKFAQATSGMDWENQHFELQLDRSLETAIEAGQIRPKFAKTINEGVVKFYNRMNSLSHVDAINELPSDKKSEAIRATGRMLAHALSQFIRLPKIEEVVRAEMAMEFISSKDPSSSLSRRSSKLI